MRYKVTVSYDGSSYYGFQKQLNQITIEEKILIALKKVYKKDIKITASGRTDRGVHAIAQVFHFDTETLIPPNRLLKAVNRYLPLDIRIIDINEVDDNFHARFGAVKKTYEYIISQDYDLFYRNYRTFVSYKLDINRMNEAVKLFIGTHDFLGFCSYVKNKPTIKTIYEADLKVDNGLIILTFTGDNFLRYMVRKMVGTLIDIGLNRKEISIINEIFEEKDGRLCGKTAAPEGLYLKKVYYK